ncbi:MAG: TetR/AcrR family transcriptional regulator [Burkholderiales bacterium]|nr:TetR/AcrR family transcriptional regulator [Burkholderiales bacterium]
MTTENNHSRRTRKLQKTSEQLSQCAWQLFESKGYEATTMEIIAEAADVARGTLYRHFPVKEAFIAYRFKQDQLVHQEAVITAAMACKDAWSGFTLVLSLEASYAERMHEYLGPFLVYRLAGQQTTEQIGEDDIFFALSLSLIARGQRNGEFNTKTDALRLAEYLAFLRLATLMRWLGDKTQPLLPLYEEMLQFFMHGAVFKN